MPAGGVWSLLHSLIMVLTQSSPVRRLTLTGLVLADAVNTWADARPPHQQDSQRKAPTNSTAYPRHGCRPDIVMFITGLFLQNINRNVHLYAAYRNDNACGLPVAARASPGPNQGRPAPPASVAHRPPLERR